MTKPAITSVFSMADSKSKSRVCSLLFIVAALVSGAYLIGSAYLSKNFTHVLPELQMNETRAQNVPHKVEYAMGIVVLPELQMNETRAQNVPHKVEYAMGIVETPIVSPDTAQQKCKAECNNSRPIGSKTLPKGILVTTSNLNMRPLWGPVEDNRISKKSIGLLTITVGIKQKSVAGKIVEKFLADGFVVMLFHYDDEVDGWRDFRWNNRVIHVAAMNQSKWWFAKRFLHPDLVEEYDYIFMWDEDLGVQNFHPRKYVSIVKEEGLEISQPALDPAKSEVHYPITARQKHSKVHRRYINLKGGGKCNGNTLLPPCIGFVEMMAPVFSRAAWRCAWYMIQNDLIHAWGLDMKLGYCAQGDKTTNVGIVDSEYIVHMGLPTLGGVHINKGPADNRTEIRRRAYAEMQTFTNRWRNAVEEDECWVDLYEQDKY